MWQLQSVLDFGPIVKPLGITVKKEAGKVVETSGKMVETSGKVVETADVVRPQFRKRGQEPLEPKRGPKKIFKILRLFENLLWRGASVDVGIFIAYFGGKKWRAKCTQWQWTAE